MRASPSRRTPSCTTLRRGGVALLVLAVAAWSGAAFAWSARGHSMVGDIATKLLTPTATVAVAELLRDDLGADGKPSGRSTLGQVASWPDEIRALNTHDASGAYHFDDVPICGVPDKAKYCPDGKCATVWYTKQLAILEDRTQPRRARNEALKWVVHLVGDMSQPLHEADDGDRGGNDVQITFLGKREDDAVAGRPAPYPYNLHTAWDRLIPYRLFDTSGGYDAFLADMPSAATDAAWSVGTSDEWAEESSVLAQEFVYPALHVDVPCGRPIHGVVAIDAVYDRSAAVIVATQLRKAGVRLAKVLNDALSESAVESH